MKHPFIKIFIIGFVILNFNCKQSTPEFDTNFVHVVYFWLHNPDNANDRQEFEEKLNTFMAASEYAKTRFIGIPSPSERDVVDDSFTYSLIVSFASKETQDKYQSEPAHLKFVEDAKHLWSKVIVYDSLEK